MASLALALSPFAALAINSLIYLFNRRYLKRSIGVSIAVGFVLGLIAVVALIAWTMPQANIDSLDAWVGTIMTYTAVSFGFWAFLNLNITSIRISILRYMLQNGATVNIADLLATYAGEKLLQRRLLRLTAGGQVVLVEGKWRISSPVLLSMARFISIIRKILLLSLGGTPNSQNGTTVS